MTWGVVSPDPEHRLTADERPDRHPAERNARPLKVPGLRNVDARVRCRWARPGQRTTLGGSVLDTSDITVFLGLDVGKGDHHGHGLTAGGKTVLDKRLPNSEPKL